MQIIDYSKHKFSPHAVGKLLTEPKLKKDKEAGLLGQTTKTYLNEVFVKKSFGREKDFSSKEIIKGLSNEQLSLDLCQKVKAFETGKDIFMGKNKKTFENDYLIGTPDHVGKDFILDVKTSWDMFTFMAAESTKMYEWQIKAYCFLTEKGRGELSYCLTDTPSHLVDSQSKSLFYQMGVLDADTDEDYIAAVKQMERNHKFEDIPEVMRVKTFKVEIEENDQEFLYGKIEKARKYLIELQENFVNKHKKQ